jgi:predicted acetyltransferase
MSQTHHGKYILKMKSADDFVGEIGSLSYNANHGRTRSESIAMIEYITISPQYRGMGCCIRLIKHFAQKMYENGIIWAELDDCSDNQRLSNNVYLLVGFQYKNDVGPEMICKISDILKCCANLKHPICEKGYIVCG